MTDSSLTHEQKVEKLLVTSAILQAQLLNLAVLESANAPKELKSDILGLVSDAQSSIQKVMRA